MKTGLDKLSPRAKAIMQLGGAVAGGIILMAGCGYIVKSSQEINAYLIDKNPAMYISGVADFLEENPGESGLYQAELSELVRSVNPLPALGEVDRFYLFESNASLVDADKAAYVCETDVVGRLEEEERLEYVLSAIDSTDNKQYLKIVGQMLKNVGEDTYNSIADIFRK